MTYFLNLYASGDVGIPHDSRHECNAYRARRHTPGYRVAVIKVTLK